MELLQVDAHRKFEAPGEGETLIHSALSHKRIRIVARAPSFKYVLSGREVYHYRGRRIALEPGDFLFVQAGVEIEAEIASRTETVGLCAYLNGDDASLIETPFLLMRAPGAYNATAREINSRIERGRLKAAYLQDGFSELKTIALGTAAALQGNYKRLQLSREAARVDLFARLERARGYILDNLYSPINLDALAKRAGLSKHHFLRQFKAAYGQTPIQFFSAARLEAAHARIARGGDSVETVSALFGYSGQAAFSKAFKRRYGIAPSSAKASKF